MSTENCSYYTAQPCSDFSAPLEARNPANHDDRLGVPRAAGMWNLSGFTARTTARDGRGVEGVDCCLAVRLLSTMADLFLETVAVLLAPAGGRRRASSRPSGRGSAALYFDFMM